MHMAFFIAHSCYRKTLVCVRFSTHPWLTVRLLMALSEVIPFPLFSFSNDGHTVTLRCVRGGETGANCFFSSSKFNRQHASVSIFVCSWASHYTYRRFVETVGVMFTIRQLWQTSACLLLKQSRVLIVSLGLFEATWVLTRDRTSRIAKRYQAISQNHKTH